MSFSLESDREKLVTSYGEYILHFYDIVDSTNLKAKEFAGCRSNSVIISKKQTNGYGRLERKWDSNSCGGLYMSVILHHNLSDLLVPSVSIAAAVAVQRTLHKILSLPVKIKWPNDIQIYGRKICGIISETVENYENVVITGFGVNINQETDDFSHEVRNIATSLFIESSKKHSIIEIASEIVYNFDELCHAMYKNGFPKILEEYRINSSTLYRKVLIKDGDEILAEGIAEDFDLDGSICIRKADGSLETFNYGEVSSREI